MPFIEIQESFGHPDIGHFLRRNEFRRVINLRSGRADYLKQLITDLSKPRLIYRRVRIELIENKVIHLTEGVTFSSAKLAKTLRHCEEIICFVATIGSDVEEEIVRLTNMNRLSEAYILESLGSMMIEHTVERFHLDSERSCTTNGSGVTLRFSPGYCDWQITDQKNLFLLLNSDQIGVTLTASCIMHPRKSISGVFGIFPADNDNPILPYNPCIDCKNMNCTARRM